MREFSDTINSRILILDKPLESSDPSGSPSYIPLQSLLTLLMARLSRKSLAGRLPTAESSTSYSRLVDSPLPNLQENTFKIMIEWPRESSNLHFPIR